MMDEEQTYNCVFCKESFDDKETLQTHFRKHADPNFNRSEKVKKLQDYGETAQEKSAAKAELVSCDVCTEVFPTISKAITHKHKMHPDHDAKYFCDWCGKLFTMKHLYNKHLVSHESMEKTSDEVFHCDSCNVDFNVPSAMIYHNKFFHRQDTELPTVGHSRKQILINQELVAIYYCAFCGEEFINKVNLHKHMADDHGEEDQSPEEVLRCPLCDAVFYHLDAYEAHLTTHSSDDIYTGKNMIPEDLTEFTLDSVPPVLEKVENLEPEDTTSMDLNKLLQLTDTNDDNNDSGSDKRKHKKHKKHKKSKKEKTMTLDEFLNMNTDVFGEDLDFEGIEVVPTQVVNKRLKKVKPPVATGSKMASKADLDKLKQLGIAVKMKKTNNVPTHVGIKVAPGTKIPAGKSVKIANSPMASPSSQLGSQVTTTKPSNEDVLKKLMSGHNQIKIEKKISEDPEKLNPTIKPVPSNQSLLGSLRSDTPENIEVDCDLLLKGSSETERESSEVEPEELSQLNGDLAEGAKDKPNSPKLNLNAQNTDSEIVNSNAFENAKVTENSKFGESQTQKSEENNTNKSNETTTTNGQENMEQKNKGSLNVLKNISQQITIKSLRQTIKQPLCTNTNTDMAAKGNRESSIVEGNEDSFDNNYASAVDDNEANNTKMSLVTNILPQKSVQSTAPEQSLQSLKNLSQHITIKSSGQSSSKECENNVEEEDKYGSDQESMDSDQNNSDEISTDPQNCNQSNVTEYKGAKSLDALKHLGIIVKSTTPTNHKNDRKVASNDIPEHANPSNMSCGSIPTENLAGKSLNALKSLGITVKSTTQTSHNSDTKAASNYKYVHNNPSNMSSEIIPEKNPAEKSLVALKGLGITVKSTKTLNDDVGDSPEKIDETDFDNNKEMKTNYEHSLLNRKVKTMLKQQNFQHTSQSMTQSINIQRNQQKMFKSVVQSASTSGVVERNIQSDETHEDSDFSDVEENHQQIHENKPHSITNLIQNKNIRDNLSIKPKSALQTFGKEINTKTPSPSPKTAYNVNSDKDITSYNKQSTPSSPAQSPSNDTPNTAGALKNLGQHISIKSLNPVNKTSMKPFVASESEIFNIDDSDSEGDQNSVNLIDQNKIVKLEQSNVAQKQYPSNVDALRNIRRNINKPVPQNSQISRVANQSVVKESIGKEEYDDHSEDNSHEPNSTGIFQKQIVSPSMAKLINNKNINIKNMQSGNQVKSSIEKSPQIQKRVTDSQNTQLIQKRVTDSQNAQMNASFDGFFSNESSDEGNACDLKNMKVKGLGKELVLRNKDDSYSENEDFQQEEEEEPLPNEVINKLKSFNQNLSIKSSNARNTINKTVKSMQETKESVMKMQGRVMKRDASETEAENSTSQAKMMKKQNVSERPVINKSQVINDQQMSTMDAVNQEVTTSVKTIQTKTVVQEITTTVTRTIKTVNQEVVTSNKQTINNSTQAANVIRPKIVQGMRPHIQQVQNFQGVSVRQATPGVRPQFRPMSPGTPIRPRNTAVRSVRPVTTMVRSPRATGPRMPRITPVQNPRIPAMGKPLKIAPNVNTQPVKVKNAGESQPEGHFSCFKKPKESLIPDSHFMTGESSMHAASSSQVTKNFSSSIKTVNKSNNVVIASQVKSEMHSSQQMSRMSNVSGMTMMKSSQSRQAVKEVQKCEVSAPRRSTMDAIERLQRQGLLVKKPRIEEPEEWAHSGSDDEGGHVTGPLAIEGGG